MSESKTPKSDQLRALREARWAESQKPKVMIRTSEEKSAVEKRAPKPNVEALQTMADNVKPKRGRPATRTPEERKAFRAELMRKRRAKKES